LGVDFIVVKYIQKSHFDTTHFDKEWIVLDTLQYTLTKLNETGGFCWSLLSEPQSIETLSDSVVQKFGTEIENVKEDIKVFLQDLYKCGLIKSVV
jgi:hypothetical protein